MIHSRQRFAIAFSLLAMSSTVVCLAGHQTPNEVKQKYQYLYKESVRQLPDGSAAFHHGRLWKRNGINVLWVSGDAFEMAFQHGRLLSHEIADGSLEQAAKIGPNAIRNSVGDGLIAEVAINRLKNKIIEPILQYGLDHADNPDAPHLLEAYGLSESTGVSVDTILDAALGPEGVQVLLAQSENGGTSGIVPPVHGQCTDFVAWGDATEGGKVIIGRNTDYPLGGFYDKHPTVIYYNPTYRSQRYMAVTSAGFHNAGVAGMNESGIFVGVHTVPTLHAGTEGVPAFFVGQEALKSARTLDEAIAILTRFKTAAGWNYHVVSVRERRAATIELANDMIGYREGRGTYYVTTNHWVTADMKDRYYNFNGTILKDSYARQERVGEMIAATSGTLDARRTMQILGDKLDMFSQQVRQMPYTVSVSETVSSSVWIPEDGVLYVANGEAPVANNAFIELPTIDTFNPETFSNQPYASIPNVEYSTQFIHLAAAEKLYIEALHAFEYRNDPSEARSWLTKVLTEDGSNPAYILMDGLMALRTGDYNAALPAFDAVVTQNFDGERAALALYARGRIYANEGQRTKARADLQAVLNHPNACEAMKQVAADVLRKLDSSSHVPVKSLDIGIMMVPGDAYRYKAVEITGGDED